MNQGGEGTEGSRMKLIIVSLPYHTSFSNNLAYNCTYNLKMTPKAYVGSSFCSFRGQGSQPRG